MASLKVNHSKQYSRCTHILYEWQDYTEVQISITGETKSYADVPRSQILHRLDDLHCYPQIVQAIEDSRCYQTPVYYSGYLEKWYLANGKPLPLPLPYKLAY